MGLYRNSLTKRQRKNQRKVPVFKKDSYFDHNGYHNVR